MAYKVTQTKEDSLSQLTVLVDAFKAQFRAYNKTSYNEAQLRVDFISPLLKTFGWDIDNESAKTQFLRDVIQEEAIEVNEADVLAKKNPDYTLRVHGTRKLFVEAKKVAVDIEHSGRSAFQARRYGWSANLGVTILTNFDKLIVYDCRYKPHSTDEPTVARYRVFRYTEFITKFDEIFKLLSFASVGAGQLDEYFSLSHPDLTTFDDVFLKQIEKWRLQLASNIITGNPGMDEETINILVQRLLNRIVFLRICEDRDIERYETLKRVRDYEELKAIFVNSDKKYNSGLFDFIEDNFSLQINLDPEILVGIFNELYYPESPYDFSVVDPAILGQIYERYLGSRIVISGHGQIKLVEEPEVAASSGVVPTPKLIVRHIVRETLEALCEGKDVAELKQLKIADICCGSGTFLIALYDFLLEKITLALLATRVFDPENLALDKTGGYSLTLKARHDILLNNIYGVDINPYAVEVSKFSLFLKLLENENSGSVNYFLQTHGGKVLPTLDNNIKTGNSLVDETYFVFNPAAIDDDILLYKVKPFHWQSEFPFLDMTGGFDAIVGNPPYVRIQNMVKYIEEETRFYQHRKSGYTVAHQGTFDKYYLFIQRALQLLNSKGRLGFIVPNKFFIVKGGKALRNFVASNSSISKIIHFGVTQLFPNYSTYVAILVLDKGNGETFAFKRVKHVSRDLLTSDSGYQIYPIGKYNEEPWIFLSDETQRVFDQLAAAGTLPLKELALVPVGLQTSADEIYIFKPYDETATTYKFRKDDLEFEVEKEICKPCILDLGFEFGDTIIANAQMIFPYRVGTKAEVFSEEILRERFPLTWSYFEHHQDSLTKRSINGSKEPKWYQFGRSQSLTKFHDVHKLIWPVLSTKPNYIYDETNILFTGGGNGPYYSLFGTGDYSPLYFMAILSHPLIEGMVKAGASEFRGAYYSHGKQFVEKLPIKVINFAVPAERKKHDDLVSVVEQLISCRKTYQAIGDSEKKQVLKRKLTFLEAGLLAKVNELYGILDADIQTALNDQIFTTDLEE